MTDPTEAVYVQTVLLVIMGHMPQPMPMGVSAGVDAVKKELEEAFEAGRYAKFTSPSNGGTVPQHPVAVNPNCIIAFFEQEVTGPKPASRIVVPRPN